MSAVITPELALIDPELAAAARAALPDPGAFHLHASRSTGPLRTAPVTSPADTPSRPLALYRRPGLVLVGLLAAAMVYALPFDVSEGNDEPNRQAAPAPHDSVSAGRARPSGTTFAWSRIQNAQSYRLDVRRAAEVVYTTQTKATKAALPSNPRLPRGTYSWRVAPIYELSPAGDIGPPIVEGTFAIGQ